MNVLKFANECLEVKNLKVPINRVFTGFTGGAEKSLKQDIKTSS